MSTLHDVQCPHCLRDLLVEVRDHLGGLVQQSVQFLDPMTGQPAVPSTSGAVPEHPAFAAATPAALAHAEATGVDITTVEGTGKPVEVPVVENQTVATITKSDVAAAADEAQNPSPVTEPPPATPAAVKVADEHGVDLTEVQPAGDKITKADVIAHVEGQA